MYLRIADETQIACWTVEPAGTPPSQFTKCLSAVVQTKLTFV